MRADPVVSQRLQQAAEQLQAAIRSTRKRRKSDEDVSSPSGERLSPSVLLKPEREDVETVSEEGEVINWRQQETLNHEEDSDGTSLASGSTPQSPTKGAEELSDVESVDEELVTEDAVEEETRKALDWMQRDVEKQTRENRAVRETLVRAIHDLTDIIAQFVSPDAAELLVNAAAAATGVSPERDNNAVMLQLAPDKVDGLVVQWEEALVSWREQSFCEKQQLVDGFAHFEEECLARMKAGEASHRSQRERLVQEANAQQMIHEDHASRLSQKIDEAQNTVGSLHKQIAKLSSQMAAVATASVRPGSCDASTTTDQTDHDDPFQRQILDLAATVKSAELYALRCEVALADQTQRTCETEARVSMLLEECQARRDQQEATRPNTIQKEAMQMHRQKLELLEGRMQDVLQQVACDHEQFEYEQAKWALEKRHHREKYDEVLDASVKVLKVLIIREKLMKKHERVQKRQSSECQEKQLELACQAATLQGMTHELMQQSAMVLLVLQQLAVLKANAGQSEFAGSWTLPAKPVQMKTMIKRLKKIEAALGRHDWVSVDNVLPSFPKVCPYTSTRAS